VYIVLLVTFQHIRIPMSLNRFYSIAFDKEKHEVIIQWTSQTRHMGREEFRAVLTEILEAMKAFDGELFYYIADTRHFAYTLDEDDQKWSNDNFLAHLPALGIHHFAIVITPDIFAQISIEQTMEMVNPKSGLVTRYFEKAKDARIWFEQTKVKD